MSWGQTGVLDIDSPGATDRISGHGVWAVVPTADDRLEKTEPLNLALQRTLGRGNLENPQQRWVVGTATVFS